MLVVFARGYAMVPYGTRELPGGGFRVPAAGPERGVRGLLVLPSVSHRGVAAAELRFLTHLSAMAANPTPTSNPVLLARCRDMARGCAALGEEIGIKQWTAEKMEGIIAAAEAADMGTGEAHVSMGDRRRTLRAAEKAGRKQITACRLRLTVLFGPGWSADWAAAGFPPRRTMVPERHGQRMTLLSLLAGYFQAHPEHESEDMGATAAACHAAHEALSDARSAVNGMKTGRSTSVKGKRTAYKNLRKAMRGLIQELGQLLAADDTRWKQFGLRLPARTTAPGRVRRVKLTVLGSGFVQAQWPAAPRATRYRVQIRLGGAGAFSDAATVHGTEKLLTGLPPGQLLEVRIAAANDADEAEPCPVATVTVG